MVAADVHGKNHHVEGCFGQHVLSLRMRVADGRILEVSDEQEPELFRATLGGMGLTGHILEVTFRMRRVPSTWIWEESRPAGNVEELVDSPRVFPVVGAGPHHHGCGDALDPSPTPVSFFEGIFVSGKGARPEKEYGEDEDRAPREGDDFSPLPPRCRGGRAIPTFWRPRLGVLLCLLSLPCHEIPPCAGSVNDEKAGGNGQAAC